MLIRNLMSMGTMRIVSALLTMGLLVGCARMWGIIELGNLALLTTIFLFCQLLPLLGLHLHLIREVSAKPELVVPYGATGVALALVVSLVLCVGLGVGGGLLYKDQTALHVPLWLIGFSLLPTAFVVVMEALLMAQQHMNVVAKFNIVENVGRTAIALLLVLTGYGLDAVFTVFLGARVLVALCYLRLKDNPIELRLSSVSTTVLLDFIGRVPVFFSIIVCSTLVSRLDVLLLSKLASPLELGLYASPAKLYEVGLMVPQIVMVVIFPHLSQQFAQSSDKLIQTMALLMKYCVLLAWPLLVLAALMAPFVLQLFGTAAAQGSSVMALLMLALAGAGVNQLLAIGMLVINRPDLDLKSLSVGAVLTGVGLLVLIPLYGSKGAALTVLIMSWTSPLIRLAWLTNVLPLARIWSVLRQLVLGALVLTLVTFGLWNWLNWAAYGVGLALYVVLLQALGTLNVSELRSLRPTPPNAVV